MLYAIAMGQITSSYGDEITLVDMFLWHHKWHNSYADVYLFNFLSLSYGATGCWNNDEHKQLKRWQASKAFLCSPAVSSATMNFLTQQTSSFISSKHLAVVEPMWGCMTYRNIIWISFVLVLLTLIVLTVICTNFNWSPLFESTNMHVLLPTLFQLDLPHCILNWLISFLTDRSQLIKCGDILSLPMYINSG